MVVSIDIQEFEERSAAELEELSNPERVLLFLHTNDDRAWKATEIASETGITPNSVHPVLTRLEEKDLVRHKGPFWAITDDRERLHAAYDLHRLTKKLDSLYGEEAREQWVDTAESD